MSDESEGKKALNSDAAKRIYGAHSGFRNLKAYQVAELCYDFTCRFCKRYVPFKDRHHDQMVQAARSGYQNIAEGSEDAATSKKLEMNLTNVAKSSIGELERDYRKHLKRHGLRVWEEGEAEYEEARKLRPETMEDAAAWINSPTKKQSSEERAANLGAVLASQAHWLLERLLNRQAEDFEKGGGFAERLYKTRSEARRKNGHN